MTFKVIAENGKSREVSSRSEAEDVKSDMEGLGMSVRIEKEGETDGGTAADKLAEETGKPKEEFESDAEIPEVEDLESAEGDFGDELEKAGQPLPERNVSDDPFEWMPGHYIDHIDGSPAINRQGYAVLSQFYDINVVSDVIVGPEETDFEYCRCEATAYDSEGNEYRAHGSAHVDRGDDKHLLLEMADTRATKRVLAISTGVGAVAVEELKNEL